MSDRRPIARYFVDGDYRRFKDAAPRFVRDHPGKTRPELARIMAEFSTAPYEQVYNAVAYGVRYVTWDELEVNGDGVVYLAEPPPPRPKGDSR